jgi:aspartyl-tRNA(Asn)/glutamyl-tRNA(Gln) amidotransferase subunit A
VRAAVEAAARVFADLGAIVERADPFSESPLPIFQTLALGGFWALLRSMTPEQIAVMDPGLAETCRLGETVTQEQLVEALGKRAALGAQVRQFFDRYDILLSPTMPITAAYAEPRDDAQPVGLDALRVRGRTADRADGDRAALLRSRCVAGLSCL